MKIALFLALLFGVSGLAQGQETQPPVPVFPGPGKTDKPVVPPKADPKEKEKEPKVEPKEKVDPDGPPVADPDEATLPLTFVKNRIESLPVGAKAYVAVGTIRCDSARRCWLDPDGLYGTNGEGRTVLVTKEEGGFSLTVSKDAATHQWVAQELPVGVKWMPVKAITAK